MKDEEIKVHLLDLIKKTSLERVLLNLPLDEGFNINMKSILEKIKFQKDRTALLEACVRNMCRYYSVDYKYLLQKTKKKEVVYKRYMIWYVLNSVFKKPLIFDYDYTKLFGYDRTTGINGINVINESVSSGNLITMREFTELTVKTKQYINEYVKKGGSI